MNQRDKDAMAMVGDRPAKLPARADSRACVPPRYRPGHTACFYFGNWYLFLWKKKNPTL